MPGERLTVLVKGHGPALRRSFPPNLRVSLGRDPACHLVLPGPGVSRRHVELSLCPEGIVVSDRSANGTRAGSETVRGSDLLVRENLVTLTVGGYQVTAERQAARPQGGAVRRQVQARLLERLELRRRGPSRADAPSRAEVQKALEELVDDPAFALSSAARRRLVRELTDEALGLGPLDDLLRDPAISEIMVVDPTTIYAERAGRLELTGRGFTDDEAVRAAIERIVTPLGRRIDESSPLVDARLPDGSRVNAVIPPLALRGPCITIRKFPAQRLTMDDLVAGGSLSRAMARFLGRSVELRKNVLISGGTGSGKTTLLNVLSAFIDPAERVVTIEDAAELSLAQPHVVGLESKPANLEGRGEVSIRALVKNALRMRPDRIVVGECRGGETIDMLQAMNTGHEGSMTTTHANTPAQAIARIELLCAMAGLDLPPAAIRRQIAGSIDLVVQQSRLSSGRRKVTRISEVVGVGDDGAVKLCDLFEWRSDLDDTIAHQCTGYLPSYCERLGDGLAEMFG